MLENIDLGALLGPLQGILRAPIGTRRHLGAMLGPLMKGMSEGSFGLASCWLFDGPVWVAPHGSHLGSLVALLWVSLSSLFGVLSSWTIFLEAFLGSLCCFRPGAFGLSWLGLGRVLIDWYFLGRPWGSLQASWPILGSFLGLAMGILSEI